jgi:hypothetical protein
MHPGRCFIPQLSLKSRLKGTTEIRKRFLRALNIFRSVILGILGQARFHTFFFQVLSKFLLSNKSLGELRTLVGYSKVVSGYHRGPLMMSALSKSAKTTAPWCSHVLTNHSTRRALTGLTSEIERDPVLSGRYGRS